MGLRDAGGNTLPPRADARIQCAGAILGAAPNTAQGIYALGATIYCLLTGHLTHVEVDRGRYRPVSSLKGINEVRPGRWKSNTQRAGTLGGYRRGMPVD